MTTKYTLYKMSFDTTYIFDSHHKTISDAQIRGDEIISSGVSGRVIINDRSDNCVAQHVNGRDRGWTFNQSEV